MGAAALVPVRHGFGGDREIERALRLILKREKALQVLDVLLTPLEVTTLGEHAFEARMRGRRGEFEMLVEWVVRARNHALSLLLRHDPNAEEASHRPEVGH